MGRNSRALCQGQIRYVHFSGLGLVNTKDGVQLEIQRTSCGSGNLNCHVFFCKQRAVKPVERSALVHGILMEPKRIPLNALIVSPTYSGKMKYLLY